MDTLDELVRDTMDLYARQANSLELPARLTRRLRRHSRLRGAGAALAVAGTVTPASGD